LLFLFQGSACFSLFKTQFFDVEIKEAATITRTQKGVIINLNGNGRGQLKL